MRFSWCASAFYCALLLYGASVGFSHSQSPPSDAVRVTVSMHPDGSRTVWTFDSPQHKAVATTTDPDGKVRQTIRYQLDNAGRFSSGEVLGPDGRIRLKSRYKYDDAGRILEETQSAADGTFQHKIAYSYDPSGKQIGYSVLDASGKLVSRTVGTAARPSASPKPRDKNKRYLARQRTRRTIERLLVLFRRWRIHGVGPGVSALVVEGHALTVV